MARGENDACYADAYRLLYFARSKQVSILNGIVEELAKRQDRNGYWAHEYPNPFATAAVVHALHAAKQAGADVSDAMVRRAADAIAKTRGRDREQAYMAGRRPSSGKDSMARTPMCELALLESSQGTVDDVAEALELYWKHREKLDAVRVSDFHADNELGGFFYFHGVFHSAESVFALEADQQKKHLARFREQILSLPEIDGSFIDSHELGKSYGTAMALLVLSRTR